MSGTGRRGGLGKSAQSKGGASKGGASKGGAGRALKTRVKTTKKRSSSSTSWLQRQLNDPFVAEAKRAG